MKMKKIICCILINLVAVAIVWTQERFIPRNDFSATPRAGQSEIIITNTERVAGFIISINGARAAQILAGETEKIIVNNGNVSVEASRYDRNGNVVGTTASLILNPNSQSVQLRVDATGLYKDRARIRQTGIRSLQAESPGTVAQNVHSNTGIVNAVRFGTEILLENIPARSIVAVISIASRDREMTEFIIGEIEFILVNDSSCRIVDRRRLDTIRQEQNFQMTGEVDDNSAVSIGRLLGANIVITGSISGSGTTRRLRLTAINVQTGEVVAMASERF